MMHDLLQQFIILWAVIDPIGSIPVFLAVAAGYTVVQQRKLALYSTLIATILLLFFIVAGQFLLESMNIALPAFQIAGGIVLFLFALTMIFGDGKPQEEKRMFEKQNAEFCKDAHHKKTVNKAVFPLAIPSIASPGAMMAVVMLTDNYRFDVVQQSFTAGLVLLIMLITLILLFMATFIYRIIGDAGASVISRVMGLILAAVATNSILEGIKTYFAIAV